MKEGAGLIGAIKRSPRLYGVWRTLRARVTRMVPDAWATSRLSLRRHAVAARREERSHAGEAPHLGRVLTICGISGGFVVDMAAGDGVNHSSTLPLFRSPDWRGLAVEMDPTRFRRLEYAYRQFDGAVTAREKVTPDNVETLLRDHAVPREFEVLNLDLDSYDLWVAEALLGTFHPAVITMEINEKIPPPVYFAVKFDPDHVWRGDHFYGCSLVAASEIVKPQGYVLESLHYDNALFVRRDVAEGRFEDRAVEDAYEEGYWDRPDRRELFPWNHDMEHLGGLTPDALESELRERFRDYEGLYVLEIRA